MNIACNKLSLSHCTFEIPEALDRDKKCIVTVEAEIDDVGYPDNHDGTYHQVFKAKHNGLCAVAQGDKVIRGKSKSKVSARMRARAWVYANENGIDPDVHYEETANKIIAHWDVIVELLKTKN